MNDYPMEKSFSAYTVRLDRMPYSLSEEEKARLTYIFDKVMEDLAFYAKKTFIERLFETEFLIRIYDTSGEIVGFGNAAYRTCGGVRVLHIMSVYVLPDFKGYRAMDRAWRFVLVSQAIANDYCVAQPLYFTASTVNLQVLYTVARSYSIWPDFLDDSPLPSVVKQIAEGANDFYPAPGDRLFQVKITETFAGLKDGTGHDTANSEFNRKFRELANPDQFELVFFVGRIDAEQLAHHLQFGGTLKKKLPRQAALSA